MTWRGSKYGEGCVLAGQTRHCIGPNTQMCRAVCQRCLSFLLYLYLLEVIFAV